MIPPELLAAFTPLLLEVLFADPLIFIAGWLLLGWFLLRTSSRGPANDGAAVAHQHHEDDGLSTLQLALLGASLYVLLRYWRNR